MKIGIFFSEISPQTGGGYTYEYELLISLLSTINETKHNYIVFSYHDLQNELKGQDKEKISNIIIPKSSVIRKLYLYFFEYNFSCCKKIFHKLSIFQRLIVKNQIELMIFFNPFHELVDSPYVTVVWDLQHRLQPWFPEVSSDGTWDYREMHYTKILQRASIIITGTKQGKSDISLLYDIPPNQIEIIPMPTPSFVLKPIKKKNTDIFEKYQITGKYVLYPAQFWAHKNHINLIEALQILRENYNIQLSIVFVGSDKGNLSYLKEAISKRSLTNSIHILGFVPQEELIHLYQNAFALIFPTFFGPDNLPPLEAFALKCPVIASNVAGAEEQLGDAVLFIDPKNPEDIAKAVLKLNEDPLLREQLIKKGYDRALKWTGRDFMKRLYSKLDDFENIRKCWY